MQTVQDLDKISLLDPSVVQAPFAFYEMARQVAPVYKLPVSMIPGTDVYLVTSYELVQKAIRDWKTFSNDFAMLLGANGAPDPDVQAIAKEGYPAKNTLLTLDPPAHKKYRTLVNKAFNAARVNSMHTYIETICNELIDAFEDKGECDFFEDFSIPLPIYVIADQLGVPRADLPKFRRWSDDAIANLGKMNGKEAALQSARSVVEFQHYFRDIIEARRGQPEDDIISDLVNVTIEDTSGEEGRLLDLPEILSIVQQLLVAGNETTRNALAGGMLYMTQQPELQKELADNPAVIPNAVEEILRLEASTKHMWRVVKNDTELGGVAIPAGSALFLSYDAANRDPDTFPGGEACNFHRENAASHMSFGQGTHFCVGALLARQEMKVAYECLFSRLSNWELAPDMGKPAYIESVMHRGLVDLRLKFKKRG